GLFHAAEPVQGPFHGGPRPDHHAKFRLQSGIGAGGSARRTRRTLAGSAHQSESIRAVGVAIERDWGNSVDSVASGEDSCIEAGYSDCWCSLPTFGASSTYSRAAPTRAPKYSGPWSCCFCPFWALFSGISWDLRPAPDGSAPCRLRAAA